MENKTTLALNIIGGGLLLGVLGDWWLRAAPWGINFFLWTLCLVLLAVGVGRVSQAPLKRDAIWLVGPILVAAAGIAWREAEPLKVLDCLALSAWLGLAVCQRRGANLAVGGVCEQVRRLSRVAFDTVAGYIPLFQPGVQWPESLGQTWGTQGRRVAVGGLLAVPALVIFGALFAAADAVFETLLKRLLHLDFPTLLSHLAATGACAWIAGGYLRSLLMRAPTADGPQSAPVRAVSLGAVEVGVALGLVNVLFLGFLLVQVRYLFGGADLVQVTPGLTYAEYARRGFFELVAVVALALPMLLGADWLLGANSKRGFRVQAAVLGLMLWVVLASAGHRLRLYQNEYGWTQLRFYVAVFMTWLALVLAWFGGAVLRGRREHFAFGAFVMGFAFLVGLHLLNPDDWIVRQNLARSRAGKTFDAHYAARLSADAFPALAQAWSTLPTEDQDILRRRFNQWRSVRKPDWRGWSWGWAQADRALATVWF